MGKVIILPETTKNPTILIGGGLLLPHPLRVITTMVAFALSVPAAFLTGVIVAMPVVCARF